MIHSKLLKSEILDEISVKLLEQGVGKFEVLQRALPSIVLARIDKIVKNLASKRFKTYPQI